jgi:hypothetical protein
MGLQNKDYPIYVTFDKGRLKAKINGVESTHGELTGMITGLSVSEDEYQGKKYKKISVEVTDEKQIYILQMSLAGGYGVSFCMMLPSISYGHPITISGSEKTVEGKQKRTVFLKQGGQNLRWSFTKENPADLPPLKVSKDKLGMTHYDSTDQQTYFILMLEEIGQLLAKKKGVVPEAVQATTPVEEKPVIDDGLPF